MTDDRARIEALLGRAPQGTFTVVVRDPAGEPVVIENSPLLDDGTPMPTRYWLVGRDASRRVGTLEAAGGVRRAEHEVDPRLVADAHARYAAARDVAIPADHTGPRPSGGVGGTRTGVKCLHAHYAWHLAGGDDPVGAWVARELATVTIELGDRVLTCVTPDRTVHLPTGVDVLRETLQSDPPRPEELTNAIGQVIDHVDDLVRQAPATLEAPVRFGGAWAAAIADVEHGAAVALPTSCTRADLEEVFRTVATEPVADRRLNPGLRVEHVDGIVAACCAAVGVARALRLDEVGLCR